MLLGAWRGDRKNDEEKAFLRRGHPQRGLGAASVKVGQVGAGANVKKLARAHSAFKRQRATKKNAFNAFRRHAGVAITLPC